MAVEEAEKQEAKECSQTYQLNQPVESRGTVAGVDLRQIHTNRKRN